VVLALATLLLGSVLAVAGSGLLALASPRLVLAVARAVEACPAGARASAGTYSVPYDSRRRRGGTRPAFECRDAEGEPVRPRTNPQSYLFLALVPPLSGLVWLVGTLIGRLRRR
jgi:hypothetical protein